MNFQQYNDTIYNCFPNNYDNDQRNIPHSPGDNPYNFIIELPSLPSQVWLQADIEDVQQFVYYFPHEDSIMYEEFFTPDIWTSNIEQANSHQQLLNDEGKNNQGSYFLSGINNPLHSYSPLW